jgi:hypothetical protein
MKENNNNNTSYKESNQGVHHYVFPEKVIYIYIFLLDQLETSQKGKKKNFSFFFWISPAPSPPLIHCRMVTTSTLPTTEHVFLTALDLTMIKEQHNTLMPNYDKHHIC